MSVRRYDVEFAVPAVVVAYLQGKISAEMQEAAPVIPFFDPMIAAESNRIIVDIANAQTNKEAGGNFSASCVVTVKSRWTQANMQEDIDGHQARLNAVRDALLKSDLDADLETLATAATGFGIDSVTNGKDFRTEHKDGWLYSDTSFKITGFFR